MNHSENWYGVKCLFLHNDLKKRNGSHNYEERVLLVYSESFDKAIEKAEREAKEYCQDLEGVEYLEFCSAFHIAETEIVDCTEIYSLIRKSDLDSEDYIDKFYDTGQELTQKG